MVVKKGGEREKGNTQAITLNEVKGLPAAEDSSDAAQNDAGTL
jgi:hypothetical protein